MNVRDLIKARKVISDCGLAQSEALVLGTVGNDSVLVGSIVIWTGLGNATVTQVLNSLERRGMVKRSICESDRRNVVVDLTEQGLMACERLRQRLMEI